ncbi:MAG TPA: universal stress protein [Steroidobacteraceae bacterium]|nr:universal stress protein [Steroidobacteraceae bacterium]
MYKTIFVPTSGSDTDATVFATALTLARPFAAHLHFCHLHLQPAEAALHAPHVEFSRGPAIADALSHLRKEGNSLAVNAHVRYEEFCRTYGLPIQQDPSRAYTVTASWSEEPDEPVKRLLLHSRRSDLIVLGRPCHQDYLPGGLIETLLLESGRPIVLAADKPPRTVANETVVVGWKERAEAARAVAAAMPLLEKARRVILLAVVPDGDVDLEGLNELARQLAWHGISAEVSMTVDKSGATAQSLAGKAAELAAGLLVVGGYGRGQFREQLFGGVTRSLLESAALPVFMVH